MTEILVTVYSDEVIVQKNVIELHDHINIILIDMGLSRIDFDLYTRYTNSILSKELDHKLLGYIIINSWHGDLSKTYINYNCITKISINPFKSGMVTLDDTVLSTDTLLLESIPKTLFTEIIDKLLHNPLYVHSVTGTNASYSPVICHKI